jgi:hypothetical protein
VTSHILNTDSIIASGEIASGTFMLVPEDLRARVDAFAGWFRDNGPFTADQQIAARRSLVKQLARRLSIERDVVNNPEIRDEVIACPVFVIGFPRTGTSILHSLLEADPDARGPKAWNTYMPSPPPGQYPHTPQRKVAGDTGVQAWIDSSPGILSLHPYWDDMAETLIEDEEILSIDFRNTYPTMFCEAPGLMMMTGSNEPDGAYAFLKLFMQHQQWKLPKKRWVMKGVDHQRYLKQLFATFPDARCLFPHREPGQFMPSSLAIGMAAFDGINAGGVPREAFAQGMIMDFERRIALMMNEPLMDDPRVRHFRFDAFIQDPVGLMRTIYGEWGLAWSAAIEANMRAWLDNPGNDSSRYGRHKYTFEPFGVDWEKQGKFLDAYRARYLSA